MEQDKYFAVVIIPFCSEGLYFALYWYEFLGSCFLFFLESFGCLYCIYRKKCSCSALLMYINSEYSKHAYNEFSDIINTLNVDLFVRGYIFNDIMYYKRGNITGIIFVLWNYREDVGCTMLLCAV